jgi:uncharacterized membrane protein YhaH (DUF805 family)
MPSRLLTRAPRHWFDDAFRFSGRANRAPFWCLTPICALAVLAPAFVAAQIGMANIVVAVILGVGGIVVYWIMFAVTVRRLHDRDRTGHWAWLFFLGPTSLGGLAQGGVPYEPLVVFGLCVIAIWLWLFIECGFLRGSPGPNRFGPNPIAIE